MSVEVFDALNEDEAGSGSVLDEIGRAAAMIHQLGKEAEIYYTSTELARQKRVHPSTIRELFVNEPGVLRFGRARGRGRRRYYVLRIPKAVADRVFGRLTVGEPRGGEQLAEAR
jgi:hypothetical protein